MAGVQGEVEDARCTSRRVDAGGDSGRKVWCLEMRHDSRSKVTEGYKVLNEVLGMILCEKAA